MNHIFTMDVDAGCKYFEKRRRRVQRYMNEIKDSISNVGFYLKNEYGNIIPFNGQSITLDCQMRKFNSFI